MTKVRSAKGLSRIAGSTSLLAALAMIAGCPDNGGMNTVTPGERPVPAGDRPPRIAITAPMTDITVEPGDEVEISYEGEDGESTAVAEVYVDADRTPDNGNEIFLRDDVLIGPGAGAGSATWDTTNVAQGGYIPFARIDDGVNPPVVAAGLGVIQVLPKGTNPLSSPPALVIREPEPNLGLSSGDTVTVRYGYRDRDTSVKVTLLLDKDLNPSNDDVNNPGDPFDPNSNIIILPSEPRREQDPVFPPDTIGQPPANPDSTQIRTNPRTLLSTPTLGPAEYDEKQYVFEVDFTKIPVPADGSPYFLRATIEDEDNPPVHVYGIGLIRISGLAAGFVDMGNIGLNVAGARFQGFSAGEHLGSDIVPGGDSDLDTVSDFVVVGQYASPRNRSFSGGAYLIRGRRKLPFPDDTNTNGLPDEQDSNGILRDFPRPPRHIAPQVVAPQSVVVGPYRPENVGRYGGTFSINSISSFTRGVTFGMPQFHDDNLPPAMLRAPDIQNLPTAGLTSVTAADYTGDGIEDFVFGLPFVSGAIEYHDDDPCDGNANYGDGFPNPSCDGPPTIDHIGLRDQPLVIIVDGTNDQENDGNNDGFTFRLFIDAAMAGQHPHPGDFHEDDETIALDPFEFPRGLRIRGSWYNQDLPNFFPPVEPRNEYGTTVSRFASFNNDTFPELLISVPAHDQERGRVDVWIGENFLNPVFYNDVVRSLPSYWCTPIPCVRSFIVPPDFVVIYGAQEGDRFGNAREGGPVNQDGTIDVLAGAPFADRNGLQNNGVQYIIFTPSGGFGTSDLANENIPRVEIIGTHNDDQFGRVSAGIQDMNGDGIGDVAFGSPNYDDDLRGNTDAGYVGVIFGNRPLTGELGFVPEQVATPSLSGVRFYGATIGANAGESVSSAGDFNMDGYGDLLIASPGEVRIVNGQQRRGVAYLVFGGTHLINKSFNLSSVGSPELPGIVFVSPYVLGTSEEAAIEKVAGIGDIDADGFEDIALGMPFADFVNPASPNQRRVNAGEAYIVYGSNFGTNKLPENQTP